MPFGDWMCGVTRRSHGGSKLMGQGNSKGAKHMNSSHLHLDQWEGIVIHVQVVYHT